MRQVDLLDLDAVALARRLLVEPALPIRRQLLPSARVVARVPLSKLAHRHEAQPRRAAAARRADEVARLEWALRLVLRMVQFRYGRLGSHTAAEWRTDTYEAIVAA